MKITKGQLLELLRRFHIEDHHTAITVEAVDLKGNVTQGQFDQLCEILTHSDEPAWEPPPADMIQAADTELRKLSDGGVIEYYLPTIPVGEEFVVGVKGQIIKLDQETVWVFLAAVTATAELSATRRLVAIALTAVSVALFGVMAVASAFDPPPCSEFTCGGL